MHLMTMVAGGVAEAGLWQSAVLMTDLKTAYLFQASPKVMMHAQLLGSCIGAVVGSVAYRLFTTIYTIPSRDFAAPLAYMWANTARLAAGVSLPDGVWPFFLGSIISSAFLRITAVVAATRGWRVSSWIPSGVALSMGMYVPPSFTISKVLGAGARRPLMRFRGISEVSLMAAATGCILGEGTLGFLGPAMAAAGIPHV